MAYDGNRSLEILRHGFGKIAQGLQVGLQNKAENRRLDIMESQARGESQKKQQEEQARIEGGKQLASQLSDITQLPQTEFAKREAPPLTPLQQRAQFAISQIENPDKSISEQGTKEAAAIVKEKFLDPQDKRVADYEGRLVGLTVDRDTALEEGDKAKAEQLTKQIDILAPILMKNALLKSKLKAGAMSNPTQIALTKIAAGQPLTEGEGALAERYMVGAIQDPTMSGKLRESMQLKARQQIWSATGGKYLPGNTIGTKPLATEQPNAPQQKMTRSQLDARMQKLDPSISILPAQKQAPVDRK